jgi:hypothetical protein
MFSTARAVFTISLLSLPGAALAQAGPSEAQIIAGASTSKINVGARNLAGQMVATNLVNTVGRVPLDEVLYEYRKPGDERTV